MLFHKHKNGYRVQSEVTIDGVRHRKTKVVKNKAEAREFDAQFRAEMQSGIMDASIRFDIYGQQYLDNIVGLEQRTIDSYQCNFNRIKPLIKKPLDKLNNTDFVKAFNRLKDDSLAPRTIQHTYRITKMVCDQADLDFKLNIPLGSFKKTARLKVEQHNKAKALSLKEQQHLMYYLTDRKDKNLAHYQTFIFCLIALYTGMRTGELGALTWNDIDLANKTIDINKAIAKSSKGHTIKETKSKAGMRNISINPLVVKHLREYRDYLNQIGNIFNLSSWVFSEPSDTSQHLPITIWSNRVSKAMSDCNIKHSAHSLRHTHASNLLMNNCPLIQVSHRLGHADASITLKVYSHFLEELTVDFDEYLPKIHA